MLVVMVRVPMIQTYVGDVVARAVSQKIGAPVSVGKVNLGGFNRVIIDDVAVLDKKGKLMLWASRLSAKFSYIELMQGRITVTSAQIFTPKLNLYKATADAEPNFQFVLDSLASKDTTKHEAINVAINSLVVRHGSVVWNQLDAPATTTFNTRHIAVSGLSTHIIVNAVGGDSLNVIVKKLSLNEKSGIAVSSLSGKVTGNSNAYHLRDFRLDMPKSSVVIPSANLTMTTRNGQKQTAYDCRLAQSYVMLSELAPFLPVVGDLHRQAVVEGRVSGTDKALRISSLTVSVPHRADGVSINLPSDIRLSANGSLAFGNGPVGWNAVIKLLTVRADGMKMLAGKIPDVVTRLNTIDFRGSANGSGGKMALQGQLLSGAGNAAIDISKQGDTVRGSVESAAFDIGQMLGDERFGLLATDVTGEGNIKEKTFAAKGTVDRFDYNKYSYHGITIDALYDKGRVKGEFNIADPNLTADINGSADLSKKQKEVSVEADIAHFSPSDLRLFNGTLAQATYRATISTDFTASNINDAKGNVTVSNFHMKSAWTDYSLDSLRLLAGEIGHSHYLYLDSDFGKAIVYGKFDTQTLPQSIVNAIVRKLPSISNLAPLKYKAAESGDFSISAAIHDAGWARAFLKLPLHIRDTVRFSTVVGDNGHALHANLQAADVTYDDYHLKNIKAGLDTEGDRLLLDVSLRNMRTDAAGTDLALTASAYNDQLEATFGFDNHASAERLRGTVNSGIVFSRNADNRSQAILSLQRSSFNVGDSLFTIHPATVVYSKNHLRVNRLAVSSYSQGIMLDGLASTSSSDSLTATLRNVDVDYILNLVNFHSVEFGGAVSGKAFVSQIFAQPNAHAALRVENFKLIGGRLGTLHANVDWNQDDSQIDINAVAVDTMMRAGRSPLPRTTTVKGYVSPKRNYIDLDLALNKSRAEFVGNLCSSFLNGVDLTADGNLRLWGDLKRINLTGDIVAQGSAGVSPIGTRYRLDHCPVHFVENEIQFRQDSIYDHLGNVGVINGAVHHQHLSRLTYDIDISARNLFAFNLDGSDGSSFYGKVYATGDASIRGRAGEVDIDVQLTPEKGSEVVYDISSPESIASQDFIHWTSRDSSDNARQSFLADSIVPRIMQGNDSIGLMAENDVAEEEDIDIPTDIHISLQINATPDATLRLIMDKTSGDFITLNGSGGLRATYFNKGGVDIFGTYTVVHGIYSLTIQNIIKKTFVFTQGGTIVFGGDPYSAILNLKAQYPVASVSLADLQVGRSFSASNVRVNCLMDITGTPAAPNVTFDLDFPTMSTDAKQMVYSLINGEEEMNQQVLYLLAVGRFYSRGANNANSQSNQTSLAMQSILSGQLSQQINSVLSNVVKTNNWNFGANISTGDEGFNNAQYEGTLSGHLLNNRLLFDGQFGYRDKANATTSFIGDFDLRYLITPNGNFSIHVYNQSNDRYFTRNSLNTQGLGIILKKDFGSIGDLFGRKKTKIKKNR